VQTEPWETQSVTRVSPGQWRHARTKHISPRALHQFQDIAGIGKIRRSPVGVLPWVQTSRLLEIRENTGPAMPREPQPDSKLHRPEIV
jgi:hypothetical protein